MRSSVLGFYGICVAVLATSRSDLAAAPEPAASEFPVGTREPRPVGAEQCSVVVAGSRRLTTPDGRIVHVGVQTAAARGGSVLIAGTFAHTWPAKAGADDPPIERDSIIGAVIDSVGRVVALLPHPLPGRHVLHPRAASAGRSGWHLLFVESETKDEGSAVSARPVTIWYGLFDGRRWSRLERAASGLVGARLWPATSSELVVHGAEVGFAFVFNEVTEAAAPSGGSASAPARGSLDTTGVGLLRRRGDTGRWRLDTLPTGSQPTTARLLAGPRAGEWILTFAGSILQPGRGGRWGFDRSLFVATVGPSGRGLRRALVRSDAFLRRLQVVQFGGSVLAAWVEAPADRSVSGGVVRWTATPLTVALAHDADEPAVDGGRADTAMLGSNEFALASSPGGVAEALLVARDGLRRDRLRVAAFRGADAVVHELAPLGLTNHTFADLFAVAPGRFLLFTAQLAQIAARTDLPFAATLVHDLRLRCVNPQP